MSAAKGGIWPQAMVRGDAGIHGRPQTEAQDNKTAFNVRAAVSF